MGTSDAVAVNTVAVVVPVVTRTMASTVVVDTREDSVTVRVSVELGSGVGCVLPLPYSVEQRVSVLNKKLVLVHA